MSSVSVMMSADRERHEQAATWAMRLGEGAVSAKSDAEFAAWLEADPRNGEALEEIVGAWHSVDRYAASAQVMAMRESALALARRTARRQGALGLSRNWIGGLVAAAFLIVAGGAGLWTWMAPQTYATGVGERRVVALSDGSRISLDGDTRVKVAYSGGERRLWLEQGRAKFDVAKDHARPFSVVAGQKAVLATGTSFSVELVQQQVRVILYEGKVALLNQSKDVSPAVDAVVAGRTASDLTLSAGWQIVMPQASAETSIRAMPAPMPADPVTSLSWEAGQLTFDNEPLGVVVERMNRYTDHPLAIGDVGAGSLRVSGVFRTGDTAALVQGLKAMFDVRVHTSGDVTTLFRDK